MLNIHAILIAVTPEVPKYKKILVGCVYNSHKRFSCDPFFDSLQPIALNFDFLAVLGDFNNDLLSNCGNVSRLNDLIAMSGLNIVNRTIPTRYANNVKPSLLDIIAVSDISKLLLFEQISFVSDHDLLFITLDFKKTKKSISTRFSFWDYKSIDSVGLFCELNSTEWNECWSGISVDQKLDAFNKKLLSLRNRYVPFRTITVNNVSCPWFSTTIKRFINLRNRKYAVWKKYPTEYNWMKFRIARNVAARTVFKAKSDYYESKLGGTKATKTLWNNIKMLGVTRKSKNICNMDPNALNNFFVSSVEDNGSSSSVFFDMNIVDANEGFSFYYVSEDIVFKNLMNIKSNAVGLDDIPLKFIKLISPFIISPLTHIINYCITTSTFPVAWKQAKVIPTEKKVNASLVSDYRPISILSSLSKVCEAIMSEQIRNHLNVFHLLSPYQSGFRKGHS
ncbi:uncharacterized protein LOC119664481, partial [Teleopsis dalmanni]|uniref:uncharacterized protein LOC119664481 n=1 Tax=Teleopsis dalmanni TaxID=139649 RepID=UPI0018CD9909